MRAIEFLKTYAVESVDSIIMSIEDPEFREKSVVGII